MSMPLLFLFIGVFGATGVFVWLLIYLFILHQDKGEKLVGWLASLISWASKGAERIATSQSVQNKVDSFIDSINTEVEGLLPHKLKIKWVSPELSKQAFIENGEVVVLLDYHKNQDENLTKATLLYMNKAVIPAARPHINQKLSKGIDLMMTKKALFSFTEAQSSLNHFVDGVLRPALEQDSELKDVCGAVDLLDERGLFTRILLKELMELGVRRAGVTETGDSVHESNEFVKFLKKIADKERGIDVNPTFLKNDIRIAIVMVARPENVDKDAGPYLKAIEIGLKQGVRTFYLFSRGERNVEFTQRVTSAASNTFPSLVVTHEEEFPTKFKDGVVAHTYCAILHSRKLV